MKSLSVLSLATLCAAQTGTPAWKVIAPNVATIVTGITCTSDSTCYIGECANQVGSNMYSSADGGVTWTQTNSDPFSLLLLDVAAINQNVAAVGALELIYSLDGGASYNLSKGDIFGAGQCIRSIGPKGAETGFAAVGQYGLISQRNGPNLSRSKGEFFFAQNVTGMSAEARYGAFPSDQVFYIAAGDWPGEGSDDDPPPCDDPPCAMPRRSLFKRSGTAVDPAHYQQAVAPGSTLLRARGARLHLLASPSGQVQWATVRPGLTRAANLAAGASNSTWDAQIAKTIDGGKTWSVVFSNVGEYYFNDIECGSETQCCAVAETGGGVNGTDGGGAYILCTNDGGVTWKEDHVNPDPMASIIGISALSATEFWAVGAKLGQVTAQYAQFYHTVDTAADWQRLDDPGLGFTFQDAIDIECTPGDNCWVVTLDVLDQESSVGRLYN